MNLNRKVPGQPGEGATAAAVAGLGRDVEAVRRLVERLDEARKETDQRTEHVGEELLRLGRTVSKLAGEVKALAGAAESAEPVLPDSWLNVSSGSEAADVLERLVVWLDAVYLRYADARERFPACWLWHPDIVEELLWLAQAWHAAYTEQGSASVARAADWHDRYRPGVVRRVATLSKGCSVERHTVDMEQQAASGRVAPLRSAVAAIAEWWPKAREGQVLPPEPTDEQQAEAAARTARSASSSARRGGAR